MTNLRPTLKKVVRPLFVAALRVVRSTGMLSSLLYDAENILGFSNLGMHEKMLADTVRLNAYAKAIQRAVRPGHVVLDLGCGTGILSLFAAQRNPRKIYAIEHANIIELAKRVAKHNGATCIDFVQMNSREFTTSEKIDVIIHEQIGSFLFDENLVENLLDLKARVLKPDGKIIPAKFQLFLEPVCLKEEHRRPLIWENNIHGVDFSFLKNEAQIRFGPGNKLSGKVNKESAAEPGSLDYYLCKPEPIFEFDLDQMHSPSEIPNSITSRKVVIRSGPADGISIYFKAVFDEGIAFDNALDNRSTNWRSPIFRIPRTNYEADDIVTITLQMDSSVDVRDWLISISKPDLL